MLHTTAVSVSNLTFQSAYNASLDKCYLTLSSLADGTKTTRQNVKDWANRHLSTEQKNQAIVVLSGIRKSKALAYPVSIAVDYLEYRAHKLKDVNCQALLKSIVISDIERTIREAHDETVTPEQHESNRTTIRLDLVKKYLGTYKKGEPLDCDILGLQGVSDSDIYHSRKPEYSDFQLANET